MDTITREFTLNDDTIICQVWYKKRKTLGIHIDAYGNIELRVPRATSDEAIRKLVEAKWHWITTKSGEMKERTKGFKKKEYSDGETFLLLGREYPIAIHEGVPEEAIAFDGETLHLHVAERDPERMKQLMTGFYKKQCKQQVEKRIRHHQPAFKDKPRKIAISANKKTWGTCSSKRELTFNWKLVMAPLEVLDYVVVHEMCHMVHLNHDRSFWRLVGRIKPDYEACQAWLAESHWKMVV